MKLSRLSIWLHHGFLAWALLCNAAAQPANDFFAARVMLSGATVQIDGSNVSATKESGEPDHAGDAGGKSVWWSWTAPASGGVTLSTGVGGLDSLLGVYTGSSVSNLSLVASNDGYGNRTSSQLTFNAVSNQTYQFAVDGRYGAEGGIHLTLSLATGQFLFSREPREDFWLPGSGEYPLRIGGLSGNGSITVNDGLVFFCDSDSFQTLDGLLSSLPRSGTLLDTTSGAIESGFPQLAGNINAVVTDGVGGWYVGGAFTVVGNVPWTNLVHILHDNTFDASWEPKPNGAVTAMVLSDSTLYVSGDFTTIAGQSRAGLAAFDLVTRGLKTWQVTASDTVRAMALERNTLYVAGSFTTMGGFARKGLAGLDVASAAVTSWDPAANSFLSQDFPFVETIAVSGDTVYLGGPIVGLVAVDALNGRRVAGAPSITYSFADPEIGLYAGVVDMMIYCNRLYLAGQFDGVNGAVRHNLGAVDLGTGAVTPWNPDSAMPAGQEFDFAAVGDTLYVVGGFERLGGQPRFHLAAVDAFTGQATAWNPALTLSGIKSGLSTTGSAFKRLAASGNRLFVGSSQIPATQPRRTVAALDEITGRPLNWAPQVEGQSVPTLFGYQPGMLSAVSAGATIFVGGAFTSINGVSRVGLAELNRNSPSGQPTPWQANLTNIAANAVVSKVIVSSNKVFAAIGHFDGFIFFNLVQTHLAAFDRRTGATLWVKNQVGSDMALSGDVLYVCGGSPNVVALDANSGNVLNWNPQVNGTVKHLGLSGSRLYLCGEFSLVRNLPRHNLAALELPSGLPTEWNPNPDSDVFGLAVSRNGVYVAGSFTNIGGQIRRSLAELDGTNGLATDWNPAPDNSVSYVAASDSGLYVGGSFTFVAGEFRPYFAAFSLAGSPRITRQPRGQSVLVGATASFDVQTAGQEPLSYQWRFYGTNLVGATNAELILENVQLAASGEYAVEIRNELGGVNSLPAFLAVHAPVAITNQPRSQTVQSGAIIALQVTASGNPPPLYQWRLNGVPIPGAVSSSLVISNAQPTNGGTYQVLVANGSDAMSSDIATVIVASPPLPFADNLVARSTITSLVGVGSGTNVAASLEPGEPSHAGANGGRSVWLGWVAPATGVATFTTRGSSFDTLLAIYTGTNHNSLTPVASDDDSGDFYTSRAVFNARMGTEYVIAVDGFSAAAGNIVLSWKLQATTNTIPVIVLQPQSRSVQRGSSYQFQVQAVSQGPLRYQWFRNCRPIVGATNQVLSISNVRSSDVGLYFVQVSNSIGTIESFHVSLEIGPLLDVLTRDKVEDEFEPTLGAGLFDAASSPGFISVSLGTIDAQLCDNTRSGNSLGEPLHCDVVGGASLSLDFRAVQSGVLVIDTIGSSIDTVLAVYYKTNLLNLSANIVACDNNSAPDGIRSLVRFRTTAGRDYRAFVDGAHAEQGPITLNWRMGNPPSFVQSPPASYLGRVGSGLTLQSQTNGMFTASRFQWLRNGTAIAGATNLSLAIDRLLPTQGGVYSVVAGNDFGSMTNTVAIVTVDIPYLSVEPRLHDGVFRLWLQAPPGQKLVLESSSDLQRWTPLLTNPPIVQSIFWDFPPPTVPVQFFRVKPWP